MATGLSALLLSACATIQPERISVRGTVLEEDGKYYLKSADNKYFLNAMPQLRYGRYVGKTLAIEGEIPNQCTQVWEDAIIPVGDDAELVDMNRVDWSQCIAAAKVHLVTARGERQIYDWEKIELEDYFF
ncbi:hypothetical protein ACNKU7_02770 [Microbulbifer sp. SA54]|uniref:hypothetical protein n=1 Tax=Microbulbifer sp. SA54 TaxID=3401577 RepID=UPI003AAF795D